jgi:hypothetical protein
MKAPPKVLPQDLHVENYEGMPAPIEPNVL